ncbi:hypothetical protein GXW74_22200 [Roseomonas eburnea]|uniref:Uncharacterized protein n=1 Tax=Neoroseomonas eburnea TaxID=1346889 RepID=A0A9X9XHN0_9PROT|nr:hypothetical protein [Neoroseomonas eburnea]MBR0683216.1 hypothetical protein [Neoroseomonas eburnea]
MRRGAAQLLLLAGCATEAGFEDRMNALVGQPEAVLVQRLGPPSADVTLEGRRFLRWDDLGVAAPATIGPAAGFGLGAGRLSGQGIAAGPLAGPAVAWPEAGCSVRFEIMDGRAVGFIPSGSGCLAAAPR